MERYKMPGGIGTIMLSGTPEEIAHHKKMVEGRHKFSQEYIKKKGWGPPETLSIPQIMEIREQEGWKNPT